MFSHMKKGCRCAGSVTAEFAIVIVFFVMMVCGVIEFARILYMFNAMQMVTQRAATLAANADFSDAAAMSAVRQQAVFRSSPGGLVLGAPVTDAHVRIRYLSLGGASGSNLIEIPTAGLPACAANNRVTCMQDAHGASCIRMVRVQICDPADTSQCLGVKYQALFSLVGLSFDLPKATAIVPAESLGVSSGEPPCP
ncbi:MAG: TadE family protein [Duganella sp.]